MFNTVVIGNNDFVGTALCYNAVFLCYYNRTRINGCLVFHTGTYDRILCYHKRYCLTLHVRTHKSTVCVIVLKERNHRSSDRNNHLRRNVHVVYTVTVNFKNLFTETCIYTLSCEFSLLVKRLVGLCYNVIILHIGSHIGYFVKYNACFLVNLTVRSFNKAVLVYLCE